MPVAGVKVREFLCVHGPEDGRYNTPEGAGTNYVRFNCAIRSTKRYGWPAKTSAPSAVLLYWPEKKTRAK